MTIQQDAPGKLYVAGEYAVLNAGNPAVITPVGRKLTVTASRPANHGRARIESDQFPGQTADWRIQPDGSPTFGFPSSGAREKQTFTASALRTAEEYAAAKQHGRAASEPYDLRISSKLDASDGRKLGIGSSAAVAVATIKTALAWHGILPEDPKQATPLVFKLAAIAHLMAQGNGSCGDIAACAAGRLVEYRSFDREWLRAELGRNPMLALIDARWPGLSIEPLPERNDIRFLAGWTGTPASTKEFVSKTRHGGVSAAMKGFASASARVVELLAGALRDDDPETARSAIRQDRALLESFAANRGIELETPAIAAALRAADSIGVAAKTSGAGGGDCVIACVSSEMEEEAVKNLWIRIGVVPLESVE